MSNPAAKEPAMTKTYHIDVDCANCAAKMECAISKLDGVNSATVNFMTQKLSIDYADAADEASLRKAILKACRKYEPDCEIAF